MRLGLFHSLITWQGVHYPLIVLFWISNLVTHDEVVVLLWFHALLAMSLLFRFQVENSRLWEEKIPKMEHSKTCSKEYRKQLHMLMARDNLPQRYAINFQSGNKENFSAVR